MTFSRQTHSKTQMCTGCAIYFTTGPTNTAFRFWLLSEGVWVLDPAFLSGTYSNDCSDNSSLLLSGSNYHSDQVMNTTLGSPELPPAPKPLPANWGYYTRYSHQRDLAMMSIINGIERTPAQFREIVKLAGLELKKIWDCRSQVSLVEVVLPGSPLLSGR